MDEKFANVFAPTIEDLRNGIQGLEMQARALYRIALYLGCDDEIADLIDTISQSMTEINQHYAELNGPKE